MSEVESDMKLPKMDGGGAEELESVDKGDMVPGSEIGADKKLERRVLWKLDTRCVANMASQNTRN